MKVLPVVGLENSSDRNVRVSIGFIARAELWHFLENFPARFSNLFRHLAGLLGRGGIGPSQGLHLHRKAQHRKTRTHIHASSGIRTHDPNMPAVKAHVSGRAVTVTDLTKTRD
jgi:hypothetical protein